MLVAARDFYFITGGFFMSNSLYALAEQLQQAIRASEDFQQLKQAYEAVRRDETAYRMFMYFRKLQMQLHEKQMAGSMISQDEMEQAQQAMALARQNEKLSALMALEQRMSMTIADINHIAMKPLEELYHSFSE
jgi:cell fate (sporulation/competence/biofilm development) regulator YlbF (YheA/YmcA/DUF963 family)